MYRCISRPLDWWKFVDFLCSIWRRDDRSLFDRLTAYVLCPDATDYSYRDFGSAPIDSTNPSGGTGHYRDLTCTYEDGSQKTFLNDEVALKGLGAAFSLAGVCGGALLLLLMGIAALIGGRLVKPKT